MRHHKNLLELLEYYDNDKNIVNDIKLILEKYNIIDEKINLIMIVHDIYIYLVYIKKNYKNY